VVVRDGNKRWDALSGQALLNFEAVKTSTREASITPLASGKMAPRPAPTAQPTVPALCERAAALEATAPEEARALYSSILEREPACVDAHVNLGRLLHESGDVYAALLHYRAALSIRPNEATAAFNVGVALEDLGANAEAISAYLSAIEFDPRNADAHFNLARLLEQSGQPDVAVRHLLLYRQLLKSK
jgi:Flp pilus assembly protein TadD